VRAIEAELGSPIHPVLIHQRESSGLRSVTFTLQGAPRPVSSDHCIAGNVVALQHQEAGAAT